MGCCCSAGSATTIKDGAHYKRFQEQEHGDIHDEGGEVMNAIISELWPDLASATLQKMKKKTYQMRPYEMHIVAGRIGKSPTITNVKFIKGEEGKPVQYTCDVHYCGRPELEFALKGANGKFISNFLPSINVDLHWLSIDAQIHVELSLKQHYCKFYFLKRPDVEWNLDIEVTKLQIPINAEDMLDNRLEREFEAINEDKPYEINFGVDVKYKTKLGKSPKGRNEGWNSTESFHIGQDSSPRDLSRPSNTHRLGEKKKNKVSSSMGSEANQGTSSTLHVDILQAENLSAELAADWDNLADPYAVAELRHADSGHRLAKRRSTKTKMISDTLNPIWMHSERGWTGIDEDMENVVLYLKVWDGDFLTSDPLGGVKVPITKDMERANAIVGGGDVEAKWYVLEKFGTKMKKDPTGRIQLRIWWEKYDHKNDGQGQGQQQQQQQQSSSSSDQT